MDKIIVTTSQKFISNYSRGALGYKPDFLNPNAYDEGFFQNNFLWMTMSFKEKLFYIQMFGEQGDLNSAYMKWICDECGTLDVLQVTTQTKNTFYECLVGDFPTPQKFGLEFPELASPKKMQSGKFAGVIWRFLKNSSRQQILSMLP